MTVADPNDPGLLDTAEVGLLSDLYELTMAASYHREGLDRPAVFELFVRHLPPHRGWLLAAGTCDKKDRERSEECHQIAGGTHRYPPPEPTGFQGGYVRPLPPVQR